MGSTIVKPDRERDLYVSWSDNVEAPTCWGTRAEIQAIPWLSAEERADDRFDRADQYGTSALWGGSSGLYLDWDSKGMIYEQRGWLPRANLAALVARLEADEDDPVTDLLEPFDGETEVRPPVRAQ